MKSVHSHLVALFAVGIFTATVVFSQETPNDAAGKSAASDDSARTVIVDGVPEPVYHVGKGVTVPRRIYGSEPEFSDEARKRGIEGTVTLSATVTSKGETADIRVVHGRGYGLDEKAVEAVRRWKFRPATKDGKPVSVTVDVEVAFRLYHNH